MEMLEIKKNIKGINAMKTLISICLLFCLSSLSFAQYKLPEKGRPVDKMHLEFIKADTLLYKAPFPKLETKDNFPNPNTEEGKALMRQRTQKKIIQVEQLIRLEVENFFKSFGNALKGGDKTIITQMIDNNNQGQKSVQNSTRAYVDKALNDYRGAGVDISEFTLGITSYNKSSNEIFAVIMNKDGIETGKLILIKNNNNWKIKKIK
jgi:hypothetical protein